MPMTESELVRQVADRQEITQLIYRYCRSMDRIDPELGYSIWHEDAVADYGEDLYQGSGRGFIDFVLEQHRHALTHSHQVTNITLELDRDRAASESYVISALRTTVDGKLKQFTTWGRYLDTWSRRNGRWGIDKRVTIRDLDEVSDVTPLSADTVGRRDRTDPSYAVLSEAGGREPGDASQ
jgi:hypothetical protein